jgi:hypothetical protein
MRLNRMTFTLWPRMGEPRVVDTLLRISDRVAKLLGLYSPQRIEMCTSSVPIESERNSIDLSKLSVEELLLWERLHKKMASNST